MKLAQHIDLNTKTKTVTIDGEPFEYYLACEPIVVTLEENALPTITFTLLADDITITREGEGR